MALPGRAFTDDEWNELLTDFPHVGARDQFRVTGPETDVYNCLAWSMGITNNWVECPDSLADFVALCKSIYSLSYTYLLSGTNIHSFFILPNWMAPQ